MHIAQLMPLPITVSCLSKIQIDCIFLFRLTRVVLDIGSYVKRVRVCVCVCVFELTWYGCLETVMKKQLTDFSRHSSHGSIGDSFYLLHVL